MDSRPFGLSVKAVIADAEGRCLLLRRSPANTHFVGCWEWPGGKVDPGEEFASAVVRETKEETGLDVEITGLAGAIALEMPKIHVVLLCMEARIVGSAIALSHEHDAWQWASLSELGGLSLVGSVGDFMIGYMRRRERQP